VAVADDKVAVSGGFDAELAVVVVVVVVALKGNMLSRVGRVDSSVGCSCSADASSALMFLRHTGHVACLKGNHSSFKRVGEG
jgi:hypothetical protein